MNTFTISETMSFAWELFKKRSAFFIGVFVLVWAISLASSQLGGHVNNAHTPTLLVLALAGVFINIVVSVFLKMGTLSFLLKAHDAPDAAKLKDLWAPDMFWNYLGTAILTGIIVIVGLILLIVPGIIWMLRYIFAPYLVIDRHLAPLAALKESSRITYGHKWQLLGFLLVIVAINIVGALLLLVGLLVTIPLSSLAMTHAYRVLEHAASEVAPIAAPTV